MKDGRLPSYSNASDIREYRKQLLAGKVQHVFRDGLGRVIGTVCPEELGSLRRKIWNYRLKNKIRRDLQKLLDHINY